MKIPEIELQKKWFRLWSHLFGSCKKNLNINESKYENARWQIIKGLIECALNNVINAESIFSRSSQIKTEKDPDGVLDDIFAELRCIPYLLSKGFKNIQYNKENNVDFLAEFDGIEWGIEVSYIRGPNFKTQKVASLSQAIGPVYRIEVKGLLNRLKSKYQEKERQVLKHGFNETNAIVFLITDLEESFERWFDHDLINGKHPIDFFVTSNKIPTVVFGKGTIYESDHELFSRLTQFKLENFHTYLNSR